MAEQLVYSFEEAALRGLNREVLGGKAESLVRMTQAGMPVPPGFVITTKAMPQKGDEYATWYSVREQVFWAVDRLERALRKTVGGEALVSVRSGAPVSMPGMMDTLLNVGLSPVIGIYQMWENCTTMLTQLRDGARKAGISVELEKQTPMSQIREAICAVWRSWYSPRAVAYRKAKGLPDDMGTAVTIQAMVFGLGEDSGTGVAFSRNPETGDRALLAEILYNAQGEALVSGARTPKAVVGREPWYSELAGYVRRLEELWGDAVDVEFTVEDGKLWLLQCRALVADDSAAVRIASEMLAEGLVPAEVAEQRIREHTPQVSVAQPEVDPRILERAAPVATGLGVGTRLAVGYQAVDREAAEYRQQRGEPYILVSETTTPEDLPWMLTASGLVTLEGGCTCHAAIVARGLGLPAVVGCRDFDGQYNIQGHNILLVVDPEEGGVWRLDAGVTLEEARGNVAVSA